MSVSNGHPSQHYVILSRSCFPHHNAYYTETIHLQYEAQFGARIICMSGRQTDLQIMQRPTGTAFRTALRCWNGTVGCESASMKMDKVELRSRAIISEVTVSPGSRLRSY